MPDNDVEVATVAVPDLINAIKDDNFTLAGAHFNDLVSDKIQNSLNQTKVRLANQIFNGEEPADEEDLEVEEPELETDEEELDFQDEIENEEEFGDEEEEDLED